MQDQEEALNPPAEETAETTPPVESQTSEEESTQEIAPKKGAQSRIRELSGKVHSLQDKIAELTTPVESSGQYTPQYNQQENKPLVGPGEEIDGVELERRMVQREQRILQQANQMSDFRARQSATIDRINRETNDVVGKYKQLDPESDQFDSELSDAIYEAVEAKVKSDPTSSVKTFVDRQMKIYKREASKEEAGERATISKQVAQSAIRPSLNKTEDSKFEDLTVDEMRNRLGYAD